jgi:hypothetical protein
VLAFGQQIIKARAFRAILAKHADLLDRLKTLGFEVEQRDGRIAFPLVLDSAAVGRAFVDRAFDEAMTPFTRALEAAQAAVPLLEPLVAELRERR